jgi:UDPglucose 6-dehydrogenase
MASKERALKIGFVGQGYVGKNYADDFARRGFAVVRYALEDAYVKNRNLITKCDIVFIAVPTPTTPDGFDSSIVEEALQLVGKGKIAVIKSTVLPGTTALLQKKFPRIILLFSPEFLSEATASYDVSNPFAVIVGISRKTPRHTRAAAVVHGILPKSPFTHTSTSTEAELIKYAHNVSGYLQILTFNLMYDLTEKLGGNWSAIQPALYADPMISNYYSNPVHKRGRGAGGNCFIKDFAAFAKLYRELVRHSEGVALLNAAERHNIALLIETKKDLHILEKVYGSLKNV